MAQEYKKAPITEATVEFRLIEPLSDRDLERLKARFPKTGWSIEDLAEISVRVGSSTETVRTPIGHKFTSVDGKYIVQYLRKSLVVSRNAPYNGWDEFIVFVKDNYKRWRKIILTKELGRIGVRYINRIDIPFQESSPIEPRDYLNFGPPSVEGLAEPAAGWQVQLLTRQMKHDLGVILTTTTVEPALINHISILLDCDLYRYQVDVPQTDDQIWLFLDRVRESKNEIFEQCITDNTRKLIA